MTHFILQYLVNVYFQHPQWATNVMDLLILDNNNNHMILIVHQVTVLRPYSGTFSQFL